MIEIIEALSNLITEAEHLWILIATSLGIGGGLVGGGVKTKNWWANKKQTPRRDYDNGSRVVVTQATLDARDKQIAEQSVATNKRIDEVGKRIGNLHDLVIRLDKTIAVMAAKMKINIDEEKK